MYAYLPKRNTTFSVGRVCVFVLASITVHLAVLWITGNASSNFSARRTPLYVELRPLREEPRIPLAMPDASAELSSHTQGQEDLPSPENVTPNLARSDDTPSAPVLPLNIYYSSSEVDTRAEPLNEVDLVYPATPYQQRIYGVVRLNIFVNEQGEIDKVAIADSKPPGIFDEAALQAVAELKFSPAIKNGLKVKNRKTIEVVFDPYEKINAP